MLFKVWNSSSLANYETFYLSKIIFGLILTRASLQWRIQDFPEEDELTPKGVGNLLVGHFFPKTA